MPFLIKVMCPRCCRVYRYSSDAQDAEAQCPFSDCWLVEDDEDDRAEE